MSESVQKRYGRIKSKRHGELLKILEEVRFLFNSNKNDSFVYKKLSNKNSPLAWKTFRSVQNILNRVSITYKERSTPSIFGYKRDRPI